MSETVIVYHLTDPVNVESIKEKGIKAIRKMLWPAIKDPLVWAFDPIHFTKILKLWCAGEYEKLPKRLRGTLWMRNEEAVVEIEVNPDETLVGDEASDTRIYPHPKELTDEMFVKAYMRSVKTLKDYLENPTWEGVPYGEPEIIICGDVSPESIRRITTLAELCKEVYARTERWKLRVKAERLLKEIREEKARIGI